MSKNRNRNQKQKNKKLQRLKKHQKEKRKQIQRNSIFSTLGNFFIENTKHVHIVDSNIVLTNDQLLLLSFGPNFIPNVDEDHINYTSYLKKSILESFDKFVRSVFIRKHRHINFPLTIHNSTTTSINDNLHIPCPSYYPPNDSSDFSILKLYNCETYNKIISNIELYRSNANKSYRKYKFMNTLPPHLKRALHEFKNRSDIMIVICDKGLGFGVMYTDKYKAQLAEYFNDSSTFKYIECPPSCDDSYSNLNTTLNRTVFSEYLTKNYKFKPYILQNMNNDYKKYCHIKLQPKLHKPHPPVTFRPICSNISYPTYYLSKLLHFILLPIQNFYSMNDDSPILKDSFQLVHLIDRTDLFDDYMPILVSADVNSLYPSIPLDIGIDAIKDILLLPDTQHIISSKSEIIFILTMLRFVLLNCYILNSFDNKVYLQINGTAMGTPCAVVFANLFMLWHHNKLKRLFYTNPTSLNTYSNHSLPKIYKRFIDDLFLMFSSITDAQYFIKCFNLVHPAIKVSNPQYSLSSENFPHVDILDITVYITSHPWIVGRTFYKLCTKLYSKSCNTYMYLPPFSLHKSHIHGNWIKSEINRLRINCSVDTDFNNCLDIFATNLIRRGFTKSFIEPIFIANSENDRHVLKYNRICKNNNKLANITTPLTLCVTYSNIIHTIINNNTLLPSPFIKQFERDYSHMFGKKPLVICRNRKNLSKILVASNCANNHTIISAIENLNINLDMLLISNNSSSNT